MSITSPSIIDIYPKSWYIIFVSYKGKTCEHLKLFSDLEQLNTNERQALSEKVSLSYGTDEIVDENKFVGI